MVLVLWIAGVEPGAIEAELERIGVAGDVRAGIVDDGVLDVHVDVSSRAEARRVERALALAGLEIERGWIFGGPVRSIASV